MLTDLGAACRRREGAPRVAHACAAPTYTIKRDSILPLPFYHHERPCSSPTHVAGEEAIAGLTTEVLSAQSAQLARDVEHALVPAAPGGAGRVDNPSSLLRFPPGLLCFFFLLPFFSFLPFLFV